MKLDRETGTVTDVVRGYGGAARPILSRFAWLFYFNHTAD